MSTEREVYQKWSKEIGSTGYRMVTARSTLPRRFLLPYLTTLSGDQFKVLFAVYAQWQYSDQPLSFRVRPEDVGRLCDLTISEIHRILNQLAEIGYLDVSLASNLDGYLVTVPSPTRPRG